MSQFSKMRKGMKLIKEACEQNDSWGQCAVCPFDELCTILMERGKEEEKDFDYYTPYNWEIPKKEKN